MFIILIPLQILLIYLHLTHAGNNPMTPVALAVGNVVFVLICLSFYGMTTTVNDEKIRITFGIGLIRKTIKLAEVKSVSTVKTPWYYGLGIRYIPNGMLYNIRGLLGVELTLKGKSNIIRIGSQNPASLQDAILSATGADKTITG